MPRLTFAPRRGAAVAAAALLACTTAASAQRAARPPQRAPQRADSARIRADVAFLADDRLEGRFTGTAGNDSAAAYIARRFRALGLRPAGGDGYLQRFVARVQTFAHAGRPFEFPTQNVVGIIPGTDPKLRGQAIVLGAHFDHLGRDKTFATDARAEDAIRNGADDNASGTAAIMELARLIAARPLKRSVVVVAFSGEEEGTLGSNWFVDHAPLPIDSVAAMLNFDMVGRLANDRLIVYGVGTAEELPGIVDSLNAAGTKLDIRTVPDGIGPSDHTPFHLKGLPVLHFFTDTHGDYHAATDDVEKINAAGEARVVDLALSIARRIGDAPGRLTFRATGPTARMGDPTAGPRPYFGSIPDMAGDAGSGMRLNGVTPGSPADKAGVKAGDVVVEFGGRAVTDLNSYQDALTAHKPGETVTVVVLRRSATAGAPPERVSLTVTLGRRGE
jgi:hypothetical protein